MGLVGINQILDGKVRIIQLLYKMVRISQLLDGIGQI